MNTSSPPLEGAPIAGGDFQLSEQEFAFSPTMMRSCVNLFVFDDRLIELTEDLTLGVEGLRESPSGAIMNSIIRVTVNPSTTTVEIEDNDGEELEG